jgi:threonine synthase
MRRESLAGRPFGVWRYREVLPDADPVTLGEGGTPLIPLPRIATRLGLCHVGIKDESANPTGSFKARGLALAVTMARRFGAKRLAIPSAGNAGSALAAYGAAAGIPVDIFLPEDTPGIFFREAEAYGATTHRVAGTIRECTRALRERLAGEEIFDLSTLREPYRVEGKKTLGYEIAEQTGGSLPDWILYPTGGGTGLIGMCKAFDEMESLGWIDARRPRMVAVQAAGCAPIVRAFERGEEKAEIWEDPRTAAWGLRVPAALGDFLILREVRRSGGTAVAVDEDAMAAEARILARVEGIQACAEGAATLAALRRLVASGRIGRDERVLLFNTGTGLKTVDNPRFGP